MVVDMYWPVTTTKIYNLKVALKCVYFICTLWSTHADRQGVDISFTVYCLFFVRLRISPARIKLARRFNGVLRRESPILGTLLPEKPKIGRIGTRRQVLPIDVSPLHWGRARRQRRGLASIGNTCPQHVWIYGRPRRRTYLFVIIHESSWVHRFRTRKLREQPAEPGSRGNWPLVLCMQ